MAISKSFVQTWAKAQALLEDMVAAFAGALVGFVMLATSADIFGRYFFNSRCQKNVRC